MTRRAGLFALLALIALVAPVGTARAADTPGTKIGVKLLQIPASQANDPRARQYVVDHVNPGTTIRRTFQVANLGQAPAQVTVYPAAASISSGRMQFASGQTQDPLTTWVHVSHPTLTLQPHQSATEVATIAVPRDATRGEQYGVIWAQVGSPSAQGNVKLISRVGIRMYVSVGPGGAPPSSFTLGQPSASRVNGHPVLRVPLRNTGAAAVDIVGTLSLSGGPGGLNAGPFRADSTTTLAPNQAATSVFTLPAALPSGPWQAQVTEQSGTVSHAGHYTVNFVSQQVSASSAGFPWALTIGLIAAALVVAIAVLLILRERRRRNRRGSGGPPSADDETDDYYPSS